MKDFFKNLPLCFGVLAVLILGFFLFILLSKGVAGDPTVDENEIGKSVVDYIDEFFLQGQVPIELVEVSEESGVYKVRVKMDESDEFDVYATKDGKYLFPEGYDMEMGLDVFEQEVEENEEPVAVPSNADSFVACLSNQSFKIFGADWCPYCESLVGMFGGYDSVDPIYVECTEEEALCEENNITAYPTIVLGDKEYEGERTLEAFASATQCELEY